MTRISLALTVAVLILASSPPHTSSAATAEYNIIIRNALVLDGSGRPGIHADIAILGDRIDRIGNLHRARAARVIDARGQIVAPGFIDMLGQSEAYVLIDPRAMSKVMMGVTTEITGEEIGRASCRERV